MAARTANHPSEPAASAAERPATLPTFRSRDGRDHAVLEASRTIVGLFLRERSCDFSVEQLAAHAGLSERTFYRYFPRKEDAIRPYVEAGLEHILAQVRDAPRDRPLRDVLVDAHATVFDAARAVNGEALLPLLNQTERLRAVWLQVVTDAESAFAQLVAERLGIDPTSQQARMAAAVVVTAGRLALQQPGPPTTWRSPGEVFARCIELVGPALFAPSPD